MCRLIARDLVISDRRLGRRAGGHADTSELNGKQNGNPTDLFSNKSHPHP